VSTVTETKSRPQLVEPEEPRFERVEVTDTSITACFSEGSIVGDPLWWSWRLEPVTPEQRRDYEGAEYAVFGLEYPDPEPHTGGR
jgi:hypothetical protein